MQAGTMLGLRGACDRRLGGPAREPAQAAGYTRAEDRHAVQGAAGEWPGAE